MDSNWSTISALATGAGTLVLAVATFASVRSANRAARAAERSLRAGLRPLFVPSRPEDPPQKVTFIDDHFVQLDGGGATAEVGDDAIYLALALRNAGSGIGILDRWYLRTDLAQARGLEPADPAEFHRLTRDLYIAAGDFGFWQGAMRDPTDPQWAVVKEAILEHRSLSLDLLYADLEGGQRTVTRFALQARTHGTGWFGTVTRHWFLDQASPR